MNKIPSFQYDPNTATWGANETGLMWHNTADGKIRLWDGSTLNTFSQVISKSGWNYINAGTSKTVTHYLGYNPTTVQITMQTNGYGTFWISASDINTFTLSVNNTGTYYFFYTVEYNP
jgi:hypothetical protein